MNAFVRELCFCFKVKFFGFVCLLSAVKIYGFAVGSE
jgi:hypothetical protein